MSSTLLVDRHERESGEAREGFLVDAPAEGNIATSDFIFTATCVVAVVRGLTRAGRFKVRIFLRGEQGMV